MKRVGVLISGRGSNLQALIEASRAGRLGGEVALALSNRPEAPGLELARAAGIAAEACPVGGRSREEHERELLDRLAAHRIDLVCLAGYMRRLGPTFVGAWSGQLLNIHPSLLPAFPGLGAQRQALEHGVKLSGATVHLVDEGLDSGPILKQEAVPVLDDDTPESLAARILAVEHRLYPAAVRLVAGGDFRI
jgi:phosphoribosylglycinamide formyltransferase-1